MIGFTKIKVIKQNSTNKSSNLKFFTKVLLVTSLVFASGFVMNGCQSIEGTAMVQDSAFWQGMQERLKALKEVDISGRLAFVRGQDRFSANFRYESAGQDSYTLTITNPFGATLGTLKVEPNHASLLTDSGLIEDSNPNALFLKEFDMDLPFDKLQSIIMGIALEGSLFSAQNILAQSFINDFSITYRDYKTYGTIGLPSEIVIQRPRQRLTIKTTTVNKLQ